ncbi:4-hydroxybenzoate geranyltransferase 2 isoform X1 [Pyrus x bretschneideri]|uniref:4-hydroxybenzoate geranyltransferase 2 isoform X1 n=1 Tax=Pyrus x bretschneideri TaxID=225117 RepID=UPI00202F9802|nr:4-hydroxybenzoate geranyltransferase 2 isoform X1 [Pyrus x bretschneideri]
MESFLVVSLKPSRSLSSTLFAASSYHPISTPTTTATSNPNPYRYPNARRWGSFSQRHCRRDTFSHFDFDRRLRSQIWSSSSPSTVPKKGGNQTSGDENNKAEGSWIDLYLPIQAQPYAKLARLDKPIGTWLFAWPSLWSTALAASPGQLPDIMMLILFGFGALFTRGAACTINDLLDRDIDAKVERTKSRPLASGVLTPFQGISFLGFQLLLVLGTLLPLNNYSCVLGVSSWFLIFTYPLMKRLTDWPQAYLGLMINWGALLGWAAVKGSIDPTVVLPLYFSAVCWTLVYDTIYAHQDKEDDSKVGVKSTALKFGDSTQKWITGFGIVCLSCLALSGYNAGIGWPYYAFLGVAFGQLAWQISTVDLSCPADCNRKFVSNKWFGAIMFIAILFGRLSS